jgi:hypothetical protein
MKISCNWETLRLQQKRRARSCHYSEAVRTEGVSRGHSCLEVHKYLVFQITPPSEISPFVPTSASRIS